MYAVCVRVCLLHYPCEPNLKQGADVGFVQGKVEQCGLTTVITHANHSFIA